MIDLYCQKIVKECHWTLTGKCAATTAYNCSANLSSKERRERNRREMEGERAYCSDAAEAEWGNSPY